MSNLSKVDSKLHCKIQLTIEQQEEEINNNNILIFNYNKCSFIKALSVYQKKTIQRDLH